MCVITVNLIWCSEFHLERQCLQEQQQQLELRHSELTATAESLTNQLQVLFAACLAITLYFPLFSYHSVFRDFD